MVSHAMLFHASCFQPLTLNLPLNKHDGSLLGSSEDTIAQKEMSRQYVLSHPGIPVQHGSYVQTESPTTSPFRVRWSEIYEWTSLPYDITDYMNNLTAGELATIVDPGRLMVTLANLIISPATKEEHLKRPLDRYYWTTHELAAQPDGATHVHAKVEVPGGEHALTGDPDYIFLHDDYAVGIIELKTFWKVTPQTIDEVLNGVALRNLTHAHPGRLAVEQTYGYMVCNAKQFGILTTVNGWVFMYRQNGGKLFMSRVIPCDVAPPRHPTIGQALYYVSALAANDPDLPETDANGQALRLAFSDGKHPSPTTAVPSARAPPPPAPSGGRVTRSEWNQDAHYVMKVDPEPREIVFEPWIAGNKLGQKAFLVRLFPANTTVVAKVWDAWKNPSADRDNEVDVYLKLQSLWGKQVPKLVGSGNIDFLWALLIECIEGEPLSSENINKTVVKNITAAFNAIHELGVIHGDVRRQNIMVKADQSVVIIDFEISRRERVSTSDIESEDDIVEDLLIELLGDRSPCSGSGSLDGTVKDDAPA